jgi:hypothetical protein
MTIFKGTAGLRGRNPKGIFLHNDAGSENATCEFYKNWLPKQNAENGFAHYYVAQDGILQAEEDAYIAWHCAELDGNNNYLAIEICQSKGGEAVFLKNEEEALKLAAQKCKQYGIEPNEDTIKLHQQVAKTACPHRSVELHGGKDGCKMHFINKIREYMGMDVSEVKPVQVTASAQADITTFTYAVRIEGGEILLPVNNLEDYAGIQGRKITDIAIKADKGGVRYRVHVLGGGWLPYVMGYNWQDHENGYAGTGKPIDAIEVEYFTPNDIVNRYGYQKAQYRVSPVQGEYYSWQYDAEKANGQDGYAGCFGQAIDRFQLF